MFRGIYVNSWIFGKVEIEQVIKRVSKTGFDGIELVGEPDLYDIKHLNKLLNNYGLDVISICGMFPGPNPNDLRALNHYDKKERQSAIDYVKKCIDLANQIGARSVLIVPSLVGQPKYFTSKEEDYRYAVDSISKVAEYAKENNIFLTIEPINRYEVGFVHTVEDAINMAKEINNDYVRVMGDTFHMQLEEGQGIDTAIRKAGKYWFQHFHVADNTREAPGLGVLPWKKIINALFDIGYEGGISCEPLPKGSSPYDTREKNIPEHILDAQLDFALRYIKIQLEAIKKE